MMFYLKMSSIHQRKVFFGSSSSHVVHVTNSFSISLHADEDEDGHESEYFQWLEEEVDESNNINDDHSVGDVDIDRLAAMFITSCHEKFLLEKVESYRRYQDMLERSLWELRTERTNKECLFCSMLINSCLMDVLVNKMKMKYL